MTTKDYNDPEYHKAILEAVKEGRVIFEPGWNEYRTCKHCGCHTNARVPFCCNKAVEDFRKEAYDRANNQH